MPHRQATTLLPLVLLAALPLQAQTKQPPMPDMPGMDMPSPQMPAQQNSPATPMSTDMKMMTPPTTLIETELNHTNSQQPGAANVGSVTRTILHANHPHSV